jgi:tetratricopeptide (TPR) repeat protein
MVARQDSDTVNEKVCSSLHPHNFSIVPAFKKQPIQAAPKNITGMSSYTIPRYFANHYSKSPEQQEADIDKAVMEHPEDGELLLVMKAANYFGRPEKHEESMVLCERILKESAKPNLQHFAYWYAANLYFEDKQNYSKAEEYLLKLLELHPDATEAMIKIAEVNMAQKKWDAALMWTEMAATDELCSEEAHETAGNIYLEKKEYNLAMASYNKALALNPNSADTLCSLAKAYAYKEEYSTAKTILHQALALENNHAEALYCLGLCWQNEDDFYRAMDFYTKALKVRPGMPEVYNNIGKLYYDHEGDYKGAIGFFEKAIAGASDPPQPSLTPVYQNLSKLYRQMLEEEKADYYLRKWFACIGLDFFFDDTDGTADDDDEADDAGV